jgi:hypothetical protein
MHGVSLRAAPQAVLMSVAVLALGPAAAVATPNAGRARPARAAPAVVVATWHMDETSGPTMVDAVGGHDGTLNAVEPGVPGFGGSAYQFVHGFVSVPNAAALNPGRKKITLTVHLNTTAAPARPDWDIMRKGVFGNGVGEYKVEFQPTGQASCGFVGSTGDSELIAGPRLDDGRWHTVQCVKTKTSIRLVVDGRRFTKKAHVGSMSNSAPLVLGARPGSEFFRGALDEANVVIG